MDQDVPQEAKVMKNSLVNIEKTSKRNFGTASAD